MKSPEPGINQCKRSAALASTVSQTMPANHTPVTPNPRITPGRFNDGDSILDYRVSFVCSGLHPLRRNRTRDESLLATIKARWSPRLAIGGNEEAFICAAT